MDDDGVPSLHEGFRFGLSGFSILQGRIGKTAKQNNRCFDHGARAKPTEDDGIGEETKQRTMERPTNGIALVVVATILAFTSCALGAGWQAMSLLTSRLQLEP
ncbi:hypothetical protein R1flu_010710 [Riccia fluitans]|uniref:Uncharacterized protein n=1 Tax=Riccia fluitans TaxID=41844 RepID=A0ABD1Z5R4_9MARC